MDNEEQIEVRGEPNSELEYTNGELEIMEDIDLSIANQRFIQDHFRDMTLEEISVSTRLPPDVVAQYLEIFEAEARSRGIDPNQHFALSITLNEKGVFGFGIQFPREEKLEESIEGIGRLLYALNEGELKAALVKFLNHFADQRQAHALVSKIIAVWSELIKDKQGRDRPLVRADEVLR